MIGFNPCFNGSMYKNLWNLTDFNQVMISFNPCFNGSMYKNKKSINALNTAIEFQSLF